MTAKNPQAEAIAQQINERINALINGPEGEKPADVFRDIARLAMKAYADFRPEATPDEPAEPAPAILDNPAAAILLKFFMAAMGRYLRVSARLKESTHPDDVREALAKAFLLVGRKGGDKNPPPGEIEALQDAYWGAWGKIEGPIRNTHRERHEAAMLAAYELWNKPRPPEGKKQGEDEADAQERARNVRRKRMNRLEELIGHAPTIAPRPEST